MKKVFFVLSLSAIVSSTNAQFTRKWKKVEKEKQETDEKKGGFKKENLFTGGGIMLSFSNYTTVLGASPVFGYSFNKWIDAGIVLNFNYASDRHVAIYDQNTGLYFYSDDKERQTIFGPGAFVKIYPVKFLFFQVQQEENFIVQKYIPADGSPSYRNNFDAPSLLLGGGYCSGRQDKGSIFYYVSIMADVTKNSNSPYVEQLSDGSVNVLPIIRAGLQVPLFQGKGGTHVSRRRRRF